jgi:hypothetical protein
MFLQGSSTSDEVWIVMLGSKLFHDWITSLRMDRQGAGWNNSQFSYFSETHLQTYQPFTFIFCKKEVQEVFQGKEFD